MLKAFVGLAGLATACSIVLNADAAEKVQIAYNRVDPAHAHSDAVKMPTIREAYEFYPVTGTRVEQLRSQLQWNGVSLADGKKFDSVTTWNVRWDYDYDRTAESCSPEDFRVIVEVTFKYPRWDNIDDAPSELVEKWDGYMTNLVAHENGHRDRVVHAAEDLVRKIAALPAARTCAELDRTVWAVCNTRLGRMHHEQKEYDHVTDHGISQGAFFP